MKVFFLFLTITVIAIIQSSLLVYFPIYGLVPNLLFITVLIYNLLEDFKKKEGFYVAAFAGFWIDVFSTMPIGTYIGLFIILVYLLKKVLKKYIEINVS